MDVEALKRTSAGLKGTIAAELAEPADHFSEGAASLLKFHGTYQQDNRDARKSNRESGEGPDFGFMIRTKNPGGFLPAKFYAAVDDLAEQFGDNSVRATTRGGLQIYGVAKGDLRHVIAEINAHLGSTLGACGDINRNVMAPPFPFAAPEYVAARKTAVDIADLLTPQATAYYEIWQDGDVVHTTEPDEPIYGTSFLPRKFKIAVTVPRDNSVDLYTNDLGVVVITAADGTVTGYNLTVGGGLGTTHGKKTTYPRLADEFAFVEPAQLLDVVRAIVIVQRDNGDRTDRRHARLKYLIADRGLAWFRSAVEAEAGVTLGAWQPLPAWTQPSYAGWQEQGDGRWFLTVRILAGRIRGDLKHAVREIVDSTGVDLVATPDQNLVIPNVSAEQRATIDAILARPGVSQTLIATGFPQRAMACPALPTCGLALAESERFLPSLLAGLTAAWTAAGLANDDIPTVRMTGCPNGCARPYLGEIGIVGVSADRYTVALGGAANSTRLNALYREKVKGDEIAPLLAPVFADFARNRQPAESFGDFCERSLVAPEVAVV